MQFTKQVRPLILPEIANLAANCDTDLHMSRPFETKIVEWLSPVVDLSDFYVYPVNGITDALDYWQWQETRTITVDTGDYEWVVPRKGLAYPIKYMSVPSSIDGNWRRIPTSVPVALDLAYVGTTAPHHLEIPDNVEFVFYSLSKTFALSGFRTGWLFTRKRDPRLHRLVYRAEYYNTVAQRLAEEVISRYDINYVYNLMADEQRSICKRFNLAPSDCVWLATSSDPQYEEFSRAGVARLCLTEFMGDGNVV